MARAPVPRHPAGDAVPPALALQVTACFPPAQGVQGTPTPENRTKWGTRFGYYTAPRILAAYSSGTSQRGPHLLALRFTDRTRFGALDLDAASPYRTLATFAALETAASARGLRLTLCRSSLSGGWHVYLWADDFVASADMHTLLRRTAEEAGIARFENGVCEVYPDPQHARQAFRLPCQAGFAWLSPTDGSVVRECRAAEVADNLQALLAWVADTALPASMFAGAAATLAPVVSVAQIPRGRPPKLVPPPKATAGLPDPKDLNLQRGLVYRYDRNAAKKGKPPFEVAAMARFREGEHRYQVGLERPGSRNEALRSVAFYLFFVGYLAPTDREVLLVEWLRAKHNGHSTAWLDPAQREGILAEIRRLAVWGGSPEAAARALAPRNVAERHRNEVALLAAAATLAETNLRVTQAQLCDITGISSRTVAKIWPNLSRKIRG